MKKIHVYHYDKNLIGWKKLLVNNGIFLRRMTQRKAKSSNFYGERKQKYSLSIAIAKLENRILIS